MARLKEKYKKEVVPALVKKFDYKSKMAAPKIEKVVVNVGIGREVSGKTSSEREKVIEEVSKALILITGQKPVTTLARKSISGFKLRKGVPVGIKVTLRGEKMYDFLERMIHITLPRSRDFVGIDPQSVDRKGNLTIAIKEHISFPEILPEHARRIFSLEISVVTSTKKREQGMELLRLMGLPLKEE